MTKVVPTARRKRACERMIWGRSADDVGGTTQAARFWASLCRPFNPQTQAFNTFSHSCYGDTTVTRSTSVTATCDNPSQPHPLDDPTVIMADLWFGTVIFLFTDIEGSTAQWERDQQAMADAVERHLAVLDADFLRNSAALPQVPRPFPCCGMAGITGNTLSTSRYRDLRQISLIRDSEVVNLSLHAVRTRRHDDCRDKCI